MFGPSVKPAEFDAKQERVLNGRAEERASSGWRRFFRPTSLGCLGLALAVYLWGYNYKLSLYHPHHNAPLRTLSAKLWVDQRDHADIVHVRTGARVHRHGSSGTPDSVSQQAFAFVSPRGPAARPAFVLHTCFTPLLPLRSPPSCSFSA